VRIEERIFDALHRVELVVVLFQFADDVRFARFDLAAAFDVHVRPEPQQEHDEATEDGDASSSPIVQRTGEGERPDRAEEDDAQVVGLEDDRIVVVMVLIQLFVDSDENLHLFARCHSGVGTPVFATRLLPLTVPGRIRPSR
jgi:hypothetical protein